MKTAFLLVIPAAALLVVATFAVGAETVDYPLATVNGEAITKSQVEKRQAQLATQPPFDKMGAPSVQLTLDAEIERVLLLQNARRDLDENLRNYLKKRAEDLAGSRRDPRVFDAVAEGQKTTDLYYNDLLVQAFLQRKLYDHIAVTPAEMRKYYDEHPEEFSTGVTLTVRQILIRRENHSDEDAKALADKALARVKASEDFAAVASEMSEGPYASAGGLSPAARKGELVAEVENAAKTLRAGQVSEPFESPLGWHVIKVEDNALFTPKPYEEVQGQIYSALIEARQRDARAQLLAQLKARAVIKRYDVAQAQ